MDDELARRLLALRGLPHFLRALAQNATATTTVSDFLTGSVDDDAALLVVLEQGAAAAVRSLEGVAHAGITATVDGHPFTVSPTDAVVFALDAQQYDLDDGPCLRALRTHSALRFSHDEVARLWPPLAALAARAGVERVHASALTVDGAAAGSVNLYAAGPPLTSAQVEAEDDLVCVLVDHLDTALWSYGRGRDLDAGVRRIGAAMADRRVVGIAVGILMVRDDLDMGEARALLEKASAAAELPLVDVARRITEDS
ncbi:ANTAR domain-containing protein [Rhodococcus sp. BP-349]|uniref:ANTAR domain-containing protein n=1 Tax=unclassified Rhodococcus (in: high G+C Gram-positive bacteria) TaxID=192944 RepID=UPI001C9B3A59|nr:MULTISPECIES: ANTAR domain-containing protein [unclassified Rhodococcus (in: high G+C Gram-positive bacteria)]MBY6538450.1 ANTAR domain-containing protein [Rhodococcus sp. BP-363]MBY6542787.1 ANTAR domain-containing protein [Rhodococcus sp. BP-369]MBY6562017.1 ANTAR domain-containing protein [Rhodococcus sp. BP-370]MBY6576309.1 ANTAR domain-containing protein [Rhodococcus sp. BP-364]MBY6585610.1 ANTAR domain-containing protein [Rhodococcus sp. BP-358]